MRKLFAALAFFLLPLCVQAQTIQSQLDSLGNTPGSTLYRAVPQWTTLPAGVAGQFLTANGPNQPPSWTSYTLPLTGAYQVLGTVTGQGPAAPVGISPILDGICQNENSPIPFTGSIAYRNVNGWNCLAPVANSYLMSAGTSGPPFWNPTGTPGAGSVTSVAIGVPAFMSVSPDVAHPITGAGAWTLGFNAQSATAVLAGPTPSFRPLTSADLPQPLAASNIPLPTATSIGGTQSGTAPANQFQTGISTAGVPTFAQPAFTNLSGSISLTQVPTIPNSQLATMAANTVKANITGAVATPADFTVSQVLDSISATQGNILYRSGTAWAALAPGTSGQVLQSGGAAANPSWITPAGITQIRNLLINGNFWINQRAYASAGVLASGTYAHDRWKATTASTAYTFTQGNPDTTITITAGTLAQIVEGVAQVEGGVYTLSWTGTSTCRVAINGAATTGAYAASPITTASATAGQNITVECTTGTLGLVQLNLGTVAYPFERRNYRQELQNAQRYFERIQPATAATFTLGVSDGSATQYGEMYYSVQKRAVPTLTVNNPTQFKSGAGVATAVAGSNPSDRAFLLSITATVIAIGTPVNMTSANGTASIDVIAEL